MKLKTLSCTTLFTMLLGWPGWASADFTGCASKVLNNPLTHEALLFLQSVSGKYSLHRCLVELNVCTGLDPQALSSVSGELLITDSHGDKYYVPLDLSTVNTPRVEHVIRDGHRMLHYEYIDHIPNSSDGRMEAYRLEIVKTPDLSRIESLDLGYYTSKLRVTQPELGPGKSAWIDCDPESDRSVN
jgi:hypothetical protein